MQRGCFVFFFDNMGIIQKEIYPMCKKQGFTLIELLVVVLIIGILAAVALPQYQKAVAKSRFASVKPLIKAIMDAQTVYFMENGQFSEAFDNLDIQLPRGTDTSTAARINYPNGYCYLACEDYSCGGCVVYNGETTITLYANFLQRSFSCIAYDDNALAHSICRAETGKSVPDSKDGNRASYRY
ncbi:MAG: type II secretion system protein [Elusimicrobia bacterium]|nr:type II secretion system protein [Elusimicrobiota bacterium]